MQQQAEEKKMASRRKQEQLVAQDPFLQMQGMLNQDNMGENPSNETLNEDDMMLLSMMGVGGMSVAIEPLSNKNSNEPRPTMTHNRAKNKNFRRQTL